jgi:hypothetical protein
MSKHQDIDRLFKEGLEEYKVKSDQNLEKKMAAMIGISSLGGGAAGGGSSAAGSAASGGSTAAGGTSTAMGAAGKVSLMSKVGSVVSGGAKAVVVKMGALAKTLGIIKTVTTVAVVGSSTALVVHEVDEHLEAKALESKHQKQIEINSQKTNLHQTLLLEPQTFLLDEQDSTQVLKKIEESLVEKEDFIELTESLNEQAPQKERDEEAYHLIVSNNPESSNLEKRNNDETINLEEGIEEIVLPEIEKIETRSTFIDVSAKRPDFKKESLKESDLIPESPTKESKYALFLDLSVMPFFAWQQEDNIMPMDEHHLRSVQYSPELSWQFGADARLQKKKSPWFAQIGLQYQQTRLKSDFSLAAETAEKYWEVDTINYEIVINPPLIDTLLQIDSIQSERWMTEYSKQSEINQYQILEIPIKIGYQYQPKYKNWSLEMAMGVSPAYIAFAKGLTYNLDGDIVEFTHQDLTSRWQMYAVGHLGFHYQLKKLGIFVRPGFKYQLGKLEYIDSSEKKRHFVFGTQFGVRLKIF